MRLMIFMYADREREMTAAAAAAAAIYELNARMFVSLSSTRNQSYTDGEVHLLAIQEGHRQTRTGSCPRSF